MARIDNPAGMRLDKLLKHTHTPDHVSTATHHIPLLKDFSHKEINNSVFCTGVIWTSRGTGLYLPWTISMKKPRTGMNLTQKTCVTVSGYCRQVKD